MTTIPTPAHLPDEAFYAALGPASAANKLGLIVSGCVYGRACGYDGSDYGPHDVPRRIITSPNVSAVGFCPEDSVFGTPRKLCDIYGGTGFDVLDGRAKIFSQDGEDWTQGMIDGALRMRDLARKHGAKLALLLDISAACGSQVIYDGNRLVKTPTRQIGHGVAAAALIRDGLKVLSQRDFASLKRLSDYLGIDWAGPEHPRDHHQGDWYVGAYASGELKRPA